MSFDKWFKDTFQISETGSDKELLRIAYQAGQAEQKEKDAQIAIDCWPHCADGHDIAAAIREE